MKTYCNHIIQKMKGAIACRCCCIYWIYSHARDMYEFYFIYCKIDFSLTNNSWKN